MKLDEHGFPIPEGFDGKPERSPAVSGKWTVLVFVLLGLVVGVAAVAVQFGPRFLAMAQQELLRNRSGLFLKRAERNLQEHGDTREALRNLTRAIELDPKNVEAYFVRAALLGNLHHYEEAAADYSRVIELEPDHATALNNRAYNLALAGKELEQSLADVEKALKLAGPNEAFLDTRGYLLYLLDRPEEALKDLDAALDEVQSRPRRRGDGAGEIYYHRGLVHRRLGNSDSAEQDFRRAKELGFQPPQPV